MQASEKIERHLDQQSKEAEKGGSTSDDSTTLKPKSVDADEGSVMSTAETYDNFDVDDDFL